jgi:hypothetical protein
MDLIASILEAQGGDSKLTESQGVPESSLNDTPPRLMTPAAEEEMQDDSSVQRQVLAQETALVKAAAAFLVRLN